MFELLKALKTAYDSAGDDFVTLRAANTNGFWVEEQRQGVAMPYIVMHHVSTESEYTMGDSEIKESIMEFNIFSDSTGISELMDILEKFTDAFDDVTLSYENDSALLMERTGTGEIEKDLNYWMVTLEYRIIRESSISGGHIVEAHLYNLMMI